MRTAAAGRERTGPACLGQDLARDEALELGAQPFDVLGGAAQAQCHAYVLGAHAVGDGAECGEDLLW